MMLLTEKHDNNESERIFLKQVIKEGALWEKS